MSVIPVPFALSAQTDTSAAFYSARAAVYQIPQRRLCFRAQPLEACRAWIPFTITGVVRVSHGLDAPDSPFGYAPANQINLRDVGAIGVGYMRNRDSSQAIGGLIEAGTGGPIKRRAVKARLQEWLTPCCAASASVGLIRAQQQAVAATGTTQAYGATADVGVDFGDQIGFIVTGDVTRQSSHQATTLRVGARAGSYEAVAVAALSAFLDITILSHIGHHE